MRTCAWSGGGCVGGTSDDADVWVAAVCEDELVGSPLREVVYAESRYDPERGGLLTRTQPCRYVPSAVRRMRVDAILDEGRTCRVSAAAVARAWIAHVQAVVEGRATPQLVLASGEC